MAMMRPLPGVPFSGSLVPSSFSCQRLCLLIWSTIAPQRRQVVQSSLSLMPVTLRAYGALMSFNIKDLRNTSDEELIRLHDSMAANTSVGVNYFLDELKRRDQQRAGESSERLARA